MPTKLRASASRRYKPRTPEGEVSSNVREYLSMIGASLGIWWRRWQVIRGYIKGGGYVRVGEPGDADIIATIPIKGQDGCYILHIETKRTKGGVHREAQKTFQKLIQTVPGHYYLLARSSADVEDWLKAKRILK